MGPPGLLVMRLSLAQTHPPETEADALDLGLGIVDQARGAGADLVLFPELFSTGYRMTGDWIRRALDPRGRWVSAFADRARTLGIAVGVTYLEAAPDGGPYNAVTVFDRRGNRVLHYRKVHTCAFADEEALSAGADFPTADLDTEAGVVRIGAMICFDREFPESARQLMLGGAELVLVPNACVMERHRQNQLETRAFENSLALALANYAGAEHRGGSSVVGPVAFGDHGESLDTVLGKAGEEEGLLTVDFDLEAQRRWTRAEVWGRPWRRPETYRLP